jgi:hypothetical protein
VNNLCVYTNRQNGYVIASQNAGDCKNIVCDGNGNTQEVTNDGDTPEDNNSCTSDLCSSGIPSNQACCAGDDCGANGVCGSGGQLGQCVGCNDPSDCGADNLPCMWRTCTANVCGQAFASSGTLVTNNPVGDCKRQVCDGAGNTVFANYNDPPSHPNECRYYTCVSGTPVENNDPQGTDCTNDSFWCDGDEVCNAGGTCANPPTPPCPGPDGDSDCSETCREANDDCNGNDTLGSACGGTASTCDALDTCNGSGVCLPNYATSGTPCSDNLYCTQTDQCNGSGSCVGSGDPCPGPDNDDDCSEVCREANDDCNGNDPNGSACAGGTGTCTSGICGGKADGEPCGTGAECSSGFCADGVCCNNACSGDCRACDVSGSEGSCSNYAQGTDPDNECTSAADAGPSCNSGACVCGADPSYATNPISNPGLTAVCPAGQHCTVTCNGGGCSSTTVTCPSDGTCTVSCTGNGTCAGLTVLCGAEGMCSLNCGNGSCAGAVIQCGQDSCTGTCGNTAATIAAATTSCNATNNNCTCVGC